MNAASRDAVFIVATYETRIAEQLLYCAAA